MFNVFKKGSEEPQNTNGEIVSRVDKYRGFSGGFIVYYSIVRDGVRLSGDTIYVEGKDLEQDLKERLDRELRTFKESVKHVKYLDNLIGKPIS